jgi:cytochrome c-type biogenesis protein CcmH
MTGHNVTGQSVVGQNVIWQSVVGQKLSGLGQHFAIRRLLLLTYVLAGMMANVVFLSPPVLAITAEELLADPALELRARDLSKQLRCLVCQNQSIDDSDAELAQDLRREVRTQILAGASDAEVIDLLRGKYGDYVLLQPPVSPGTYLLWAAPVGIIILGVFVVVAARRHQPRVSGGPVGANDLPDPILPDPILPDPILPDPISAGATDKPALTDKDTTRRVSLSARVMTVAMGGLVIGASLGLYLFLGRADLADQPLSARQAEIDATAAAAATKSAALGKALAAAKAAAKASPKNVETWLQLAMSAAAAGETETEIEALIQAVKLTAGDSAVKSMLAEALSRAADGQITIPARTLIAEALASNPAEPRALYLAGLAAYQDENFAEAIGLWQRLQRLSTPDAPWMAMLERNIADASVAGGLPVPKPLAKPLAGPDGAAMDAVGEMSAEDRTAMIENMVSGLATRLATTPDDVEGWRRLARAYEVLGRLAEAARAQIAAADAVPNDISQQITALETLIASAQDTSFSDDAARLVARLAQMAPDSLELLFFKGHFAKVSGDIDAARIHWQMLLDRLPKDAPIAATLQAQIEKL